MQSIGKATKEEVEAEIEKTWAEFMKGAGRVPEVLIDYDGRLMFSTGTPFKALIDELWEKYDKVENNSGIRMWYCLDEKTDAAEAASVIARWAEGHSRMKAYLDEIQSESRYYINLPTNVVWSEQVMIELPDKECFEKMGAEDLQCCTAAGVSFFVMTSDHEMYDLTEDRRKKFVYDTHPNYHDETYAEWMLVTDTQAGWYLDK